MLKLLRSGKAKTFQEAAKIVGRKLMLEDRKKNEGETLPPTVSPEG